MDHGSIGLGTGLVARVLVRGPAHGRGLGLGWLLGPRSWLGAVSVARVSVRVLAHVRGSVCTSFIHRPLQTWVKKPLLINRSWNLSPCYSSR